MELCTLGDRNSFGYGFFNHTVYTSFKESSFHYAAPKYLNAIHKAVAIIMIMAMFKI